MTPSESADLKSALERAVNSIADENTPADTVRERLDFLLWRVIQGHCTDFFKRLSYVDGVSTYEDKPVRTITRKVTNPFTGEVEEYSRDIYSKSPQWANPRHIKTPTGEVTYIHCRYKRIPD